MECPGLYSIGYGRLRSRRHWILLCIPYVQSFTPTASNLTNLLATFQKKYGVLQPDGSYEITAAWQSGLSNGALVGEILGLMAAGVLCDRYGYRFTIGLALIAVVSH